MKYIYSLFLFSILFACNSSNEEITESSETTIETNTEIIDATDGESNEGNEQTTTPLQKMPSSTDNMSFNYTEVHPNGAVKIQGNLDGDEERHGLWISYYDNGLKWSESIYSHGKKNGHSITFYPNGKVRYKGEYKDDEQTGEWVFYTEEGEVDESIGY